MSVSAKSRGWASTGVGREVQSSINVVRRTVLHPTFSSVSGQFNCKETRQPDEGACDGEALELQASQDFPSSCVGAMPSRTWVNTLRRPSGIGAKNGLKVWSKLGSSSVLQLLQANLLLISKLKYYSINVEIFP